MRLLLTSSGITNKTLETAFQELLNKPFSETLVGFIPTASNNVDGDKWWIIKDIVALNNLGCKIDIVDISALLRDKALERLKNVDVIFVEGGDTFYLMDSIHHSGIYEDFRKLLETKVYVGVSAGSAICAKNLALEASQEMYDEGLDRKEDVLGLDIVPYYVFPHYGSKEWFPKVTRENANKYVNQYGSVVYLIDDQSAVIINGENSKVISEGVWEKLS